MIAQLSDDETTYIIKGKPYPRLSQVVERKRNDGLEIWKAQVGEKEAERLAMEAATFGTDVHLVTQLHDQKREKERDKLLEIQPWLIPLWLAWNVWTEEYVVKWLGIEIVVWSDKLWVAGTIDRVAILKGDRKPSIVDIKTGSLYDEIGIKLAGYKIMYNEKRGKGVQAIDRTIAVNLPRKDQGNLKVKEYAGQKYADEFVRLAREYREMET